MSHADNPYPPIADYALISDCHCTALVSRFGSVDWCCMPRVDADSCFGRLLDWRHGGYCAISPEDADAACSRRYLPGTIILETCFETANGKARLLDFFAMDAEACEQAHYDHIRILEGIAGEVDMRVSICPRFDYGEIIPMMRQHGEGAYTACGSNTGLVIRSDMALDVIEHRDLGASFTLRAGQRRRLSVHFEPPERLDALPASPDWEREVDDRFKRTCNWWQAWSARIRMPREIDPATLRSAIVLKALTYERTGAIVAAPTTSLPEWIGQSRNWDYRFSWVRDSVFTVRALYELGYESEAERFLQFIRRASAGSAEQMQIMYGVDGKRRLTEVRIKRLEGYRKSKPVRVGNFAAKQNQLDIYGEVMEMAAEWVASGHPVDAHYWEFLADVADTVCEEWQKEDYGIWEFRGGPRHYVHSKAMCWGALERGIRLAREKGLDAPLQRWEAAREAIRAAIERDGYDAEKGVFVQAFGSKYLDSALLLLPRIGFVDYNDPRMLRTVDAICANLDKGGLLARYNAPDGLPGWEGVFLPCTFWLVRCLAYQGRHEQAREYYQRALACANDVGLFSEEFDVEHRQMLGNFPQGLTHVSQIMARLALDKNVSSAPALRLNADAGMAGSPAPLF